MFKNLIVFTCIMSLVGCASVHNGKYAVDDSGKKATQGGLIVSGEENTDLSSKYFLPMDFTIENVTDEWIVVEDAKIVFVDEQVTSKLNVVVGSDLGTWAEAAQRNASIKSYNTSLVLASVFAVGAVAAGSKNSSTTRAGALAIAGAGAGLTALGINQELNSLERSQLVPVSHLYSGPFSVPPGLHTKKWVTFYVKDSKSIPFLTTAEVHLKLKGGKLYSFKVPFRKQSFGFQGEHTNNPKNLQTK